MALLACAGILFSIALARQRRRRHELAVRSLGTDIASAVVGCGAVVLGLWLIAIGYATPITGDPVGIAYPVLILIGITLLTTYLARRRRFGRYVYAYGGNPEAAELGGINTRKTVTDTGDVMGMLCAVSAAIQTARLNSATTNPGVQNELDVIATAVIGGRSFSGGIGTIPGAVLGAVVMQSLHSGMSLLNIDSPSQDIVVGVVPVTAVANRRPGAAASPIRDARGARCRRIHRGGRHPDRPTVSGGGDTAMPDASVNPEIDRSGVPLCELKYISVAFGGLHAVDGVSIDPYPGEVVALVGGTAPGSRR